MYELKDISVNKDIGLVNTLNNVGGETTTASILNSLSMKTLNTAEFTDFLINLTNLLDIRHKIGAVYHQKAAEVFQSSFIVEKEWVSAYKTGISYDPELFPSIVFKYIDSSSYQYVSMLCECCEINAQLTGLVLAKPICLVIGVTFFVSMFDNYIETGGVQRSLLSLKERLFYRIAYLRIRPYINFYTCAFSISTIVIGGVTFNFFKTSVIAPEIVNEEIKETIKDGIKEGVSTGLKGIINTYEPKGLAGATVNVCQDFLGKLGYSIVTIFTAPLRGAYVAGVKPVIDVAIKVFEKKKLV